MGIRRVIVLAALGALVIPPVVAAVARRNLVGEGDESSDELKLYAIFDGAQGASRATAFRGGDAIAWYGGLDLDLREAELDPGGAYLRAMAIFGGARIVVPEDWAVEVHGRPIMGGVTDDTDRTLGDGPGPRLVVDATAVFGGIEITTRGDLEDAIESVVEDAAFARAEVEAEVEAAGEAGGGDGDGTPS
jgi:hypothetical protein